MSAFSLLTKLLWFAILITFPAEAHFSNVALLATIVTIDFVESAACGGVISSTTKARR